jgi:hypothetical protein
MFRRRSDRSTARSVRWGAVLGAALAAFLSASVALAGFSSSVTGGGVAAYSSKRIFSGVRSTSAWTVRDASGGGAEATKDDPLSYADGTTTTSGTAWATTFSATRYLEFDFNSALPSGLSVSSPQLNFRMASTNNPSTWCFYVEVYRVSTSTLIGTHGSSGSPYACNSGTTQTTTNIALPEVSTTTIANDLRVRIYIDDSKTKQSATDMVTVTGSTPYSAFTAYQQVYRDVSSGAAATTDWGVATSADGFAYTTASGWLATFTTSRYVKFTFDPGVPTGATITAASLDFSYRTTQPADTACWYMETYNGATLLAAHGSSSSTISCNNSNTTYTTNNVSLSEISTAANANSLTAKVYMDDTLVQATQIDLVRLNLTYYLN